jgi:hypothetical protein
VKSRTHDSAHATTIEIAFARVILWPVSRSLIATTSAAAERMVLPIEPHRLSSTSSSRKKFASSRSSRLA